jgi:hypothetical protein
MAARVFNEKDLHGDQYIDGGDAVAVDGEFDIEQAEEEHARKTGALIRASVIMAVECAPGLESEHYVALARFATAIGLAFPIQDDLLDPIGDAAFRMAVTAAGNRLSTSRSWYSSRSSVTRIPPGRHMAFSSSDCRLSSESACCTGSINNPPDVG